MVWRRTGRSRSRPWRPTTAGSSCARSPAWEFGRIYDHELVSAVQRIAGNGTGDTRGQVPGVLDWATSTDKPKVDITQETTTLYASDRDLVPVPG